ncbi:unnamed protein product [Peniophora sp. CBMAI 1063]|nr:unnamed protein product [Peniophora sp. CBMAI 1063]
MLDSLSKTPLDDSVNDIMNSQPYISDDSDDEELTLLYPDSDPESDAEVQPELHIIPQPEPLQSTPAPTESTAVPLSPIPAIVAPVAKVASEVSPANPPVLAPQPPSRPSSSLSSLSDDVPLSQIIAPRPSQPRAPSPPPRKRARLDESALTPLELLVTPSGARTLEFNAASNSYYASTRHYSVENSAISIHTSDGSADHVPPPNKGYEVLSLDDHSNRDWRKKIGELIAGGVFGKANQLPERSDEPVWTLKDFPPGYVLWRRTQSRVPTSSNPQTTRVDIYLYGSRRFASPAEYAPHAMWLMRGAPAGKCACKYCSQEGQRTITAVMEDAVIAARTAPSARRSKSFVPPSPKKPTPVSPVKHVVVPPRPLPVFPASTAPPRLVADDAEFLRALKRRRDDSSDSEEAARPRPSAPKVEIDELFGDML